MPNKTTPNFNSVFEQEVYRGLTDFPKHLSSKYFYDAVGDKLFQEIMKLPEYYLTNSELEILQDHKEAIAGHFSRGKATFNLIELGAGDGSKTRILLNYLQQKNTSFQYVPIDISTHILNELTNSLNSEFPGLAVKPVQGTYFESLEAICQMDKNRKVILFLGSNIGNLLHPQAVDFLVQVQKLMSSDDLFLVGFDQKKDPQKILDAYNDPGGVTEAFNKNILTRINRELGGDFNGNNFRHWEVYDPESGTAKSYLVSLKAHDVYIRSLDLKVTFKAWETIHTEISQKYDDDVVSWLARKAGLEIVEAFSDRRKLFKNYLFRKF
ncbi:L-histidine N(alpha)-methyltransferase [Lentiprolixibacter aurantiacus]|uniref:L-histidine N(Alpha)-methyltransferase n=1 Tax=Lentiprolixibacter aurantiacus TaxID=2993939 RepID=A0AAE3MLJ1_9FLAO|nr:L-histidine N(alpha)-methyltransferase [Lentiprolixibacter aurantiacus]MCX2719109.1 L-histidine N(alpha)-methyltransferase [Lentiprolixibacter aurantiacus]